jgi:hypothetical protein
MSLTLTEMIAEVRSNVGRLTDTTVITDTRITRWLNDAQRHIVREIVGLVGRDVKDITSLPCAVGVYEYVIAFFDPAIAHLLSVYYYDSTSGSTESAILDYLTLDEFDTRFPRPERVERGKPRIWTRRGNKIEIMPIPSSSYSEGSGKSVNLRLDYTGYATDMTTASDISELSVMENADEGLLYYATAKAWEKIGGTGEQLFALWMNKFTNPTDQSGKKGWLERYKEKSDTMLAWDGNILFDGAL